MRDRLIVGIRRPSFSEVLPPEEAELILAKHDDARQQRLAQIRMERRLQNRRSIIVGHANALSVRFPALSEDDLRSVLDHAARECCVETSEAARIARVVVGHGEVRMVEEVEKLQTDLQLGLLAKG